MLRSLASCSCTLHQGVGSRSRAAGGKLTFRSRLLRVLLHDLLLEVFVLALRDDALLVALLQVLELLPQRLAVGGLVGGPAAAAAREQGQAARSEGSEDGQLECVALLAMRLKSGLIEFRAMLLMTVPTAGCGVGRPEQHPARHRLRALSSTA